MAYDEGLAERVREVLSNLMDVIEKKMFDGLAFMMRGNMCVGVLAGELLVRVGPEQCDDALKQPHARVMDFTGRPMKGFVNVDQERLASDENLAHWVERCLSFALSFPGK